MGSPGSRGWGRGCWPHSPHGATEDQLLSKAHEHKFHFTLTESDLKAIWPFIHLNTKELIMIDKEIWAEALNLAKDQLRHGKVHFSELEVVTKSIYEKLTALSAGPIIDVQPEPMKQIEAAQHVKTKKGVKCAVCGVEFKVLGTKHLETHGLTRKEYMDKFGVTKKDMSVKIARNTLTGENNPLKQIQMIMKEFGIKRGDVTQFVLDNGFDGMKSLAAAAKEKNVGILELLKAPAEAK